MVTENKSPRGERAKAEAIANGFLTENGQKPSQKPSNLTENEEGKQPRKQPKLSAFDEKQLQKQSNLSISDFPTMVTRNACQTIKLNRKTKYSWLADNLGVNEPFKELLTI